MTNTDANALTVFTKTAAEIVRRTGCTPELAVDYLMQQIRNERPWILGTLASAFVAEVLAS